MSSRLYGSSSAGFGATDAVWTLPGFSDWSFACISVVNDVQDGNDGCYVFKGNNPVNHFLTYIIPDAAIPDQANVTLATWGLRYKDTCDIATAVRPCIDTTQVSSGYPPTCAFFFSTDTSRAQSLAQTGATTKAQTWGFVSATSGPGPIVYVSEFALKLTFTLPTPTNFTTNAATSVGANIATFNGTFNPNSATVTYPDSYFFQYGLTTAYGFNTTVVGGQIGTTDLNVSTNIAGLLASTTYHYRFVVTNADGTFNGNDVTFTTTSNDPIIMAL